MYLLKGLTKKETARTLSPRVRTAVRLIAIICLTWPSLSFAQAPGEAEFNTTCVACHTVGKGRLVGPDLAGVTERRSAEWLISFIKSSQARINSGVRDAVSVA